MDARHILPASVIAVACAAPGAQAAIPPRIATMSAGTLTEYDQTNATTGSLTVDHTRGYDDHMSARASFSGGSNGFARGVFNVDWHDGDDVWFGVALYLPSGFKAAMQGQVDLMRWDNWGRFGDNDDRSGVVIHRNGRAALMRMRFGVENVDIAPAFDIPEGRWVWLEVHQRLSRADGTAVNEVYLDGRLVAASRTANTYGRGVDRVRYGIVAIDQARQRTPLTLWFDRATVSARAVGPAGAATTPAVPTAPALPPTPPTTPAPAPTTTAEPSLDEDPAGDVDPRYVRTLRHVRVVG